MNGPTRYILPHEEGPIATQPARAPSVAAKTKAVPKRDGFLNRPLPMLVFSYLLLGVLGFAGGHRLFHREYLTAVALMFLSLAVLTFWGSAVGIYLSVILVGWLAVDAALVPGRCGIGRRAEAQA
jgi:hypothetical protein